MAAKFFVVVIALLVASAQHGSSLSIGASATTADSGDAAASTDISAQNQLVSAASAGAGGDTSDVLKEQIAKFYFLVQEVSKCIAETGANKSTADAQEYIKFKASLDRLEYLWRDGSDLSLVQIPSQLGNVKQESLTYAQQLQQEGSNFAPTVILLQKLAQAACDAQKSAQKELLAQVEQKIQSLFTGGFTGLGAKLKAAAEDLGDKLDTVAYNLDQAGSAVIDAKVAELKTALKAAEVALAAKKAALQAAAPQSVIQTLAGAKAQAEQAAGVIGAALKGFGAVAGMALG